MSQHVNRMRKEPKAAKQLKKYELELKSKDPDDGSPWIGEPLGGCRTDPIDSPYWLSEKKIGD